MGSNAPGLFPVSSVLTFHNEAGIPSNITAIGVVLQFTGFI